MRYELCAYLLKNTLHAKYPEYFSSFLQTRMKQRYTPLTCILLNIIRYLYLEFVKCFKQILDAIQNCLPNYDPVLYLFGIYIQICIKLYINRVIHFNMRVQSLDS